MVKHTTWYGIGISYSGKIIILWESSKEPVPSKTYAGKMILETSRGKVAFSPERICKVTSMKSHQEMLDRVKAMQEENPELKEYSVETH